MQEEIWKDIQGYEGLYQISNLGRVKSFSWGIEKIKNLSISNGYYRIMLFNKQGYKSFYVHRLIGIAFIDNKNNKPCINHINGIKTDNSIINLEWVTHKENNQHKFDVLGYVASKETRLKISQSQKGLKTSKETKDKISQNSTSKKSVYCTSTLKEWKSIKECAIDLNIDYAYLRTALNQKSKTITIKYI